MEDKNNQELNKKNKPTSIKFTKHIEKLNHFKGYNLVGCFMLIMTTSFCTGYIIETKRNLQKEQLINDTQEVEYIENEDLSKINIVYEDDYRIHCIYEIQPEDTTKDIAQRYRINELSIKGKNQTSGQKIKFNYFVPKNKIKYAVTEIDKELLIDAETKEINWNFLAKIYHTDEKTLKDLNKNKNAKVLYVPNQKDMDEIDNEFLLDNTKKIK